MALSTNTWLSVLSGPGVGRLLMAAFGEGEEEPAHLPFLTFTVSNSVRGERHQIKIIFRGLSFEHPSLDFTRKVYGITGFLWAIDGKAQKPPHLPIRVVVIHYMPSHHRKGDAALKITDPQGYNLDELFSEEAS